MLFFFFFLSLEQNPVRDKLGQITRCFPTTYNIYYNELGKKGIVFKDFFPRKKEIKCAFESGLSLASSSSLNSSVIISLNKLNLPNFHQIIFKSTEMNFENITKTFAVICSLVFLSILINMIYLQRFKKIFQQSNQKVYYFAAFNGIKFLSKPPPNALRYLKSIQHVYQTAKKTNKTIYRLLAYNKSNELVRCVVVFPLKMAPFSLLCFIEYKSINPTLKGPLDFENAQSERDDVKYRFDAKLFVDIDNMKRSQSIVVSDPDTVRIYQKEGFHPINSFVLQYKYMTELQLFLMSKLIHLPVSVTEFQKFCLTVKKLLDFCGIMFIKRIGGYDSIIFESNELPEIRENIIRLSTQKKARSLGQAAHIVNIGDFRYEIFIIEIQNSYYIAGLVSRRKNFIYRAAESSITMLATFTCAWFHKNISISEESRTLNRISNLLSHLKTIEVFECSFKEIVGHQTYHRNHKILNSYGSVFEHLDHKKAELIAEFNMLHTRHQDNNTILKIFNGTKTALFHNTQSYDSMLNCLICTILVEDITTYDDNLSLLKNFNRDLAIINTNFKLHKLKSKNLVETDSLSKELGFDYPIYDLSDLAYKDDVNILQYIGEKSVSFRLVNAEGKPIWYTANSSEMRYGLFGFVYCSENIQSNLHDDSLDDTILCAACDFFSLWTYDVTTEEILWSMSNCQHVATVKEFLQFIYPQDRPYFEDSYKAANSQVAQTRTMRLNLNGEYQWYSVHVGYTTERTGIILAVNTNENTIATMELNDIQEQIDLALHQTNIIQWEFDDIQEDTGPLVFDQISFKTLHFTWSAIKYNTISDYQESIIKAFKDCLEKGIPINIEVPLMSDQFRWLLLRGGFSTAQNHIFGVCFDMTELMTLKEDLKEQKHEAQEASLAKSRFLANMSHEIRAPLQGMLAVLELLMSSKMTPDQITQVKMIRQSFDRLMQLLNDVLDLAKVESGKMTVYMNNFDIFRIVEPIMLTSFDTANQKGVQLIMHMLAKTPIKYYGDENILSRILGDLLSNAVKFTSKGHVCVLIESKDDNLVISVEDTGIGISDEDQEVIFRTFDASASQTVSALGGSGSRVGLTLASKLIALVGGNLSVKSKLGVGSTFTAVFPFQPIYIPYIPQAIRERKMQIFASYTFPLHSYVESFMNYYGCTIVFDESEVDPEYLALISTTDSHDSMDRALRFWKKHQHVHIIVYTKKMYSERPQLPSYMHYCSFFYLPSDLEFRYDHVTKKKMFLPITMIANSPVISDRKKRVLLADDNSTNCLVMSKILTKIGCDHIVVNSGQEVLETLEKDPFFDILFMDQHMPDMDGPTAAKIIRSKDSSYSQIPIIAVTASILKEDEIECLNAGMNFFLTKPVSMSKLRDVIERFTSGK